MFVLLFLCVCMFCGAWHRDISLWAYAYAVVTFLIVDGNGYLFIYFGFLFVILLILRQGFTT